MKKSVMLLSLLAALTLTAQFRAEADTFSSGANTFDINFVNISSAGNTADTTGYGAVPYEYRISTYEISQDAIDKATAGGMANVMAGAWAGNQPAADIPWYQAAAFVNWMNTSKGKTAAYNLTFSGDHWSMVLWSSADAWQVGGENLYRHKEAYYFLPSENEWYKAAYYNPDASDYFLYPTAGNTAPTAVAGGNDVDTAVYEQPFEQGPASVDLAGGLSAFGTMGQGGNVWEWTESAFDGSNNLTDEDRTVRGGVWGSEATDLDSSTRMDTDPSDQGVFVGFRVASVVPEPSTYALLAVVAAGSVVYALRRRRRAKVS